MGTKGVIPKRKAEVMGHKSKADMQVDTVVIESGIVPPPDLMIEDLHPFAEAWYEALKESGQSTFYEPSDWMTAQLIAKAISDCMGRPSAMMLSTIFSGMTGLGVTEGDRRRMRIELERSGSQKEDDASVTAMAEYRRQLQG